MSRIKRKRLTKARRTFYTTLGTSVLVGMVVIFVLF